MSAVPSLPEEQSSELWNRVPQLMSDALGERDVCQNDWLPDNLTETPDCPGNGGRAWTFSTRSWAPFALAAESSSTASSAATSASARSSRRAHFAPFFPAPEKLISYHYVRSGRLVVEVDGMAPVDARARGASPSCRATIRIAGEPSGPSSGRRERDQLGYRRRRPPRYERHRRSESRDLVRLPRRRRKAASIRCWMHFRRC